MTQVALKTRFMPDLVGVADDMDGMFLPDSCGEDELVVRRGMINSREDGVVECVLAYAKGLGLCGLRLVSFRNGRWTLDKGATRCDERILEAISTVIGTPSP
jgi:hypothetical protein